MNFVTSTPADRAVSGKTIILTCLSVGVFSLIFNDLLGYLNEGGLLSAVAAVGAVADGVLSIDVDNDSLRTIFILVCAFLTTMAYIFFRFEIEKMWEYSIFLTCIIGGGFVLDAVYGPRIIEKYLSANGYYRCSVQDHEVGSGKGRIWLNNYVLNNSQCLAGSRRGGKDIP